ncbi:MAG TPA: heme-binding protein, partial [Nitrosomonas sp.]|nr:heme-binding protein [Nitrosomonas sp.]
MMKYLLLLILSFCTVSLYAQTNPSLSMALANKMVLAAAQQCENDGYKVSVAVVDKGGVILAQVRMDGA